MIKLDIVNAVVNKTGVSRTKAEQAVETVFEAMKKPSAKANASNCAASACSTSAPARPASAAIRAPARKSASRPARPCGSSPAKNSKSCKPNVPARPAPACSSPACQRMLPPLLRQARDRMYLLAASPRLRAFLLLATRA